MTASVSVLWYSYIQSFLGSIAHHCLKSVRIQSYSGPRFSAFGLNTERHSVLSVFSPNAGNTDQNNSEYGHFLRSPCFDI